MRSAQTGVLGMVVLTGIVIVIISITFMWGQPLIQKNVDKAQINMVMEKLDEINDAIIYTASTGSNNIVSLDLTNSAFLIDESSNRIMYQTYSSVPIISGTEEVPINYYELATIRESLTYNTTDTSNSDPIVTGYETITHHKSNITIGGVLYNATIHENSSNNEWDLLCLWKDYSITESTDCARSGETITQEDIVHDIISILSSGEAAYANGDIIENQGILGNEPSGIISAESVSLIDTEKITFYLTYRGMLSPINKEHKIILSCSNNCVSSNTEKDLIISRTNIVQSSNSTITYISLEVQ